VEFSPNITITDNESSRGAYNVKYLEHTVETYIDNLEFKEITFKFADIATRNVQNNHNTDSLFSINFSKNSIGNPALYYTDFSYIYKYDFAQNVVSDFKDKVVDYNKRIESYRFLVILKTTEIDAFFDSLSFVSEPSANGKITIKENTTSIASDIHQFSIVSNELIGENLYKIEMNLINSNTITANYN